MKTEVEIWEMKYGKITALKHDNTSFIIQQENDSIQTKKHKTKASKRTTDISYKRYTNKIDKWIKEKNKLKFTVKDVRLSIPALKHSPGRVDMYLSKMISDRTITQVGKASFIVNKKTIDKEKYK